MPPRGPRPTIITRSKWLGMPIAAAIGWVACLPRTDLNEYRKGNSPALNDDVHGMVASASPSDGSDPSAAPSSQGEARTPEQVVSSDGDPTQSDSTRNDSPGAADAGPTPEQPASGIDAGAPLAPAADAAPAEPPVEPPDEPPTLGPLPDDLIDAPVAGEITFSTEAVWEVDEVFEPTFEIHTPTASYWVVKPLGTIVSLEDGPGDTAQWIAFSSGFRPLRGVPALSTLPESEVTTVLDEETQTPTHLRLDARSQDGLWHWSWDFYVTHVTLTIWQAPVPTALGYRGVPGGELGVEDELRLGNGQTQGARNSFLADLPGPEERFTVTDTNLQRTLFAVQHFDDDLIDRYRVRDNDSAHWLFGDGQITRWPGRFSLGLVRSGDAAEVTQRVDFVVQAIRNADGAP